MTWKLPPRIKIYEALGLLADGRIEIEKDEDRKLSLDSARDDKIVDGKGKDSRLRGNDPPSPRLRKGKQEEVLISAKVTSSDGSKFYTVRYDETNNKITSNDNASKWQGYTGYPIIAMLMKLGKLPYDEELATGLQGIAWKAINAKYKNDWGKTEDEIFKELDREKYEAFAETILQELQKLELQR